MLRRSFLQGCAAGWALTAVQPRLVLASPLPRTDVLVVLSLRGGWDSLSAFVPLDDPAYREARPNLAVPDPLELEGPLGLHPALAPLGELYRAGNLAIVPAAGLSQESRSHFQATAWMEGGLPGRSAPSGWLARWLGQLTLPGGGFPALALGPPTQATQGFHRLVSFDDLDDLDFRLIREDLAPRLMDVPSRTALEALRTARQLADRPGRSRVDYPDTDLGWQLSQAARLIQYPELGVRAVTLELDGFDTHSDQAGQLEELFADLAASLRAFSQDLDGAGVTTVVMSEFGRTLAENASQGTDHGRGGAMLVLGPKVRGGIYGSWPELAHSEVLEVTVDYRDVLAEVLGRRMGCRDLAAVFPGRPDSRLLGLAPP